MHAAKSKYGYLVAALVAGGMTAATVNAATVVSIGSRTASGPFAVAILTKDANRPNAMYYRVTPSPAGERMGIVKTMVCSRGATTKRKRYSTIYTTSSARVKVPVTLTNPSKCSLTVNAQLENRTGSKIRLVLYRS